MTIHYDIESSNFEYRPNRLEERQKADIAELAERFRAFLQENGLWKFITIGFNGMAFDSEQDVIESFVKYYNPETLIVLHEININYDRSPNNFKKVKEFFQKNGYQIEIIDFHSFFINPKELYK
ncbi:hypothetical protein ACPV3A_16925 [Paenibacillus sp. Dod16]|uniref:hypothetical protein n=1 Tax=Paenibacillus sp. Dod16 TaxID=3416392 RepID=UPI003CF835E0